MVPIRGLHAASGGFDLVLKWCPDSIVASLSDWKGPQPKVLAARKYPGSLLLWPAVVAFAIAHGLAVGWCSNWFHTWITQRNADVITSRWLLASTVTSWRLAVVNELVRQRLSIQSSPALAKKIITNHHWTIQSCLTWLQMFDGQLMLRDDQIMATQQVRNS